MYLNYVNNFRGFAILIIIASHTMLSFMDFYNEALYAVLRVLFHNGTVLFVFIAGLLFHHLSSKFNIKRYYKSKLLNVVVPYLVISTPWILYLLFISDAVTFNNNAERVKGALVYLLTGSHMLPLWFIPMIIIFYAISPLLLKLDKNNTLYYLLPVFILISTFVPRETTNVLQSFVHFFSIYVFGMFVSKNKEKTLQFVDKYFIYLIIGLIVIYSADYLNKVAGFPITTPFFDKNNFLRTWGKLLLSVIVLFIFYKYDNFFQKKFDFLAGISFGLYFIHQYIIIVLEKVMMPFLETNNTYSTFSLIIMFIVFTIVVTLIGILILVITKKIFKQKSKQLVGC